MSRKFVFGGSYLSHVFIVDVFSAPVAYDLKKISSTATLCVRVRRSSDNAETDIGFLENDIDSVSLLSFVGVGNGFVTKWYNQGTAGATYDTSQTTAGSQPLIVSGGAIETLVTGQKSIDFGDSVSNRLLVFGSGALFNNKSYGVGFSVYQNTLTTSRNIWAWTTPTNGIARFMSLDSFTTSRRHQIRTRRLDGDSVSVLEDTVNFPLGVKLRTDIIDWANADAFIRRNGVQVASSTSHGTAGSTSATNSYVVMAASLSSGIGNSAAAPVGHISTVIFFNTDQSANISAIEAAINNNYGIY